MNFTNLHGIFFCVVQVTFSITEFIKVWDLVFYILAFHRTFCLFHNVIYIFSLFIVEDVLTVDNCEKLKF